MLFLQGGATLQFAGIPLNLMRRGRAGYVVSGNFAKLAWREGCKYGDAEVLASSEATNFDRIPELDAAENRAASGDLDYVYICQNNTIFGTQFHTLPDCADTPLVADVSSCFLSGPLDIERYGMLFAGAQKNAGGPAGVTVVIVREDLIANGPARADICPTYLDMRVQAEKGSMYNTPNTFGIYLCGKVFRWIDQTDGLVAMAQRNRAKADLLYRAEKGSMYNTPNTFGIYLCGKVFRWIDQTDGLVAMAQRNRAKADLLYRTSDDSDLFQGTADPKRRSMSNVTFRTCDAETDEAFIAYARERGIEGIKGHRMAGGLRASIYNAVTMDSVGAIAICMREFEASRGGRSI